jgi:hypothetical protein
MPCASRRPTPCAAEVKIAFSMKSEPPRAAQIGSKYRDGELVTSGALSHFRWWQVVLMCHDQS